MPRVAAFSHEHDVRFEEVARKRAILASARLQFSPETQEVREQAIETCIEHILFGLDQAGGVTCDEIQRLLTGEFGGVSRFFRDAELRNALLRLQMADRIACIGVDRFHLTVERKTEISTFERAATNRVNTVASILFANVGQQFSSYRECFYEVLGVIFSQLGERYVRVLTGRAEKSELSKSPAMEAALRYVRPRYRLIDHRVMEAAVGRFFETTNPEFDALKWNLAQNYYIAKCLGLDQGGQLLSRELFGGATLLFDTNVIFHAVDAEETHHEAFRVLADICRVLEIELQVCQISIDEARGVAAAAHETLGRVSNVIPERLAHRVNNQFYQAFRRTGGQELESFFEQYDHLGDRLRSFGVEIIDDVWFTDASETEKLAPLRDAIVAATMGRKRPPKRTRAAMHDAQLLTWATRTSQLNSHVLIVTLDRSLSTIEVAPNAPAHVISLDALLQWLAPIAVDSSVDFARIFAETLKYQVLPSENFFELEDFIVLAEMEWDCNVLPPQDVDECIRAIRSSTTSLDPRSAVDREKLARRVRKFFANPSRKFQEERQDYEATIIKFERQGAEMAVRHEQELTEYQGKLDAVGNEVAVLRGTLGELGGALDEARGVIGAISNERNQLLSEFTRFRRGLAVALLIIALAAIASMVSLYGSGDNFWQRLSSSWEVVAGLSVLLAYGSTRVAGTRNLGILGTSVAQVFSGAATVVETPAIDVEPLPKRPMLSAGDSGPSSEVAASDSARRRSAG
jgi:hypothetical protein